MLSGFVDPYVPFSADAIGKTITRSRRVSALPKADIEAAEGPHYKIKAVGGPRWGDTDPLSSKWKEEICSSFTELVERSSFYFVGAKRGHPQTPV